MKRSKQSAATYLYQNQTPQHLVIAGAEKTLKLSPLERLQVHLDPDDLGPAAKAALVDRDLDWEVQPVRSLRIFWTACLATVGIGVLLVGVIVSALGRQWPPVLLAGAAAAVLAAIGAVVIQFPRQKAQTSHPNDASPEAESFVARSKDPDTWDTIRDFGIATSQGLAAVLLIFVAVAAPACAIYYGTEVSTVIAFHGLSLPTLTKGPGSQYIIVIRSVQLLLLIVVCLVPALMYFQFDRERLSTMVDRWLHAMFRLDSTMRTIADVDAKYGRRLEEFYGATLGVGMDGPRKRLRDRSPVVICTLVIAIGWIMVLLKTNDSTSGRLPSPQELFQPDPTPMTLAFLGAYFLCIQVALRGYVRGDLKPKTYNVITIRIIMAVVLAWAMQVLWPSASGNVFVLGLAFLAGILPNTVIRKIRDVSLSDLLPGKKDDRRQQPDELSETSPLTELDEIDVYERTRLEEEGITSVQALARHDLVDLILSSRIPIPRLIDWVDQAILHQHVGGNKDSLRAIGVRSATDFLQACKKPVLVEQMQLALKETSPGPTVELLRTVLKRDEWLSYIQNWRRHDGRESRYTIAYDKDGSRKVTRRTRLATDAGALARATKGLTTADVELAGTDAHPTR